MDHLTSILFKIQYTSVGTSLLIGLLVGGMFNSQETGFEAGQAIFLEFMLLFLFHIGYFIASCTCYFLKLIPVQNDNYLSLVSFFGGVVLIIFPILYFSIKDITISQHHYSQMMFVASGLCMLFMWGLGYKKLVKLQDK